MNKLFCKVPEQLLTRTYLVGGAVRDILLGLPPKDLDYVVVGGSSEEILSLGFKQVGADFPVFLHPETGEEYALARTERKTAKGYQGFTFDASSTVTLEQDLCRRDLTINAMAMDHKGKIIDPFGGKVDLQSKTLQHVSEAFKEDPVRVLRICRFLARYGEGWSVAPETVGECLEIIEEEWPSLTPERVWQETYKALQEPRFDLFLNEILRLEFGSDYKWFEELSHDYNVPQRQDYHPEIWVECHIQMCLQQAKKLGASPEQLFSVMCHDLGKAPCYKELGVLHGHEEAGVPKVESLCDRLKVANSFRELATKVCRWHTHCHKAFELKPKTILKVFEALDSFRKPDALHSYLLCCEADAKGRGGEFPNKEYPQRDFMMSCYEACKKDVNCGYIAEQVKLKGGSGDDIKNKIRQERISAINREKKLWKN